MPNRLIGIEFTESGAEPVTLAQVKTKLRITDSDNDTELTALITPCRQEVERRANMSIIEKSIVATVDLCGVYRLPYEPAKAITEVKLITGYDIDGAAEYDTLTGDDYLMTELYEFKSSFNGVHKITYTVGMETVPADLKEIILTVIAIRYEHRGDALNEIEISKAITQLVKPYWVPCL